MQAEKEGRAQKKKEEGKRENLFEPLSVQLIDEHCKFSFKQGARSNLRVFGDEPSTQMIPKKSGLKINRVSELRGEVCA